MKILNNIFRILTIIILGSIYAFVLFNSFQKDNLFSIFIYIIIGIIGLPFYYKTILKDKFDYLEKKTLACYLPTIVGVIFIAINIGIYLNFKIKEYKPTLVKAENHGLYADFKKNRTYIIKSGSWASKTHFYGTYSIKDSLIILDKTDYDKVLLTNKLIIQKTENLNYLIQIDNKGNELNDNFRFEITLDNRIKIND